MMHQEHYFAVVDNGERKSAFFWKRLVVACKTRTTVNVPKTDMLAYTESKNEYMYIAQSLQNSCTFLRIPVRHRHSSLS